MAFLHGRAGRLTAKLHFPARAVDGTMAESYCRLEESEAVRSCCDLGGAPAGTCGTDRPPQSCDLECVEIWLPLVEIGALDGDTAPTFFGGFLHGALLCNAVLGLCFFNRAKPDPDNRLRSAGSTWRSTRWAALACVPPPHLRIVSLRLT